MSAQNFCLKKVNLDLSARTFSRFTFVFCQPSIAKIISAYWLQFSAVLYASTLSFGT